jgi:O-methyltransferase domain
MTNVSPATHLREHNVADRVRIASGSFFDDVPPGGDAYVLKNIIHDWSDDMAVQILRRVRAAADPAAVVLLIEFVLPDHHREFPGNVVWIWKCWCRRRAANAPQPNTATYSSRPASR